MAATASLRASSDLVAYPTGGIFDVVRAFDLDDVPVRVCGDAVPTELPARQRGLVVGARVSDRSSPHWYFGVNEPFVSHDVFRDARALLLSMSRVVRKPAPSTGLPAVMTIVLIGAHNLYTRVSGQMPASTPGSPEWADFVIPFHGAGAWHVGGEAIVDGDVSRVRTDVPRDAHASRAQMNETLSSLSELRVRTAVTTPGETCLLREVSVIRSVPTE